MIKEKGDKMALMNIYASDATFVSDVKQLQNYRNSDLLIAGNDKQYVNSQVILLKFQKPVSLISSEIKHASLSIYVDKKSAFRINRTSHTFVIYPNLTDFENGSVIWNNRPNISNVPLASMKIRNSDFGSYVKCDITGLVRDWFADKIPNYGITLAAPYYSNMDYLSIHSNTNSNPPMIQLDYMGKNDAAQNDNHEDEKPVDTQNINHDCEKIISNFEERIFYMHVKNSCVYTPFIEISKSRTISFFIKNFCDNSVEVILQISPDGINFIVDPQITTLSAYEMTALTPYMFAKYIRICVKNNDPCASSDVKVWYQAQLLNYTIK